MEDLRRAVGSIAGCVPVLACLALLGLASGFGCEPGRTPMGKRSDGGPAVVMVDRHAAPQVEYVDEREPNDPAHAQAIDADKGIRGVVSALPDGGEGDVDVFVVDPWKGQAGVVDGGAGMGGRAERVCRVELTAPPGVLSLSARSGKAEQGESQGTAIASGNEERLVVAALAVGGESSGVTIEVRRRKGSKKVSVPRGDTAYRLRVWLTPGSADDEREPNDKAGQESALTLRGSLAPEGSAHGYYQRAHDEDWFLLRREVILDRGDGGSGDGGAGQVAGSDASSGGSGAAELLEGSTLRIELSSVEGVTPSLKLRDGKGKVLVEAKAGKGDELRLRNAPRAAGETIALRAERGENVDVKYELRVTVEPPLSGAEVEPNNAVATATPLAADDATAQGSMAGFLWAGDVDVYSLQVPVSSVFEAHLDCPERIVCHVEQLDAEGHARFHADAAGPGRSIALSTANGGTHSTANSDKAGTDKAASAEAASGDGGASSSLAVGADGMLWLRVGARPRDSAYEAPYALAWSIAAGRGAAGSGSAGDGGK